MVALPTVKIPGYADAVRRERRVRESAFWAGNEVVAGVEVAPFSLRHLQWLELARNGFVVPCIFDNRDEMVAHAVQVLWFCRPGFRPPVTVRPGLAQVARIAFSAQLFAVRTLWRNEPDKLVAEVEQWLADAFMDAPPGSADKPAPPSYAASQAYILDRFAEANLPFTFDEIMDMPLRRLWQHWRLASRRLADEKLTNPSDDVATRYLAGLSTNPNG